MIYIKLKRDCMKNACMKLLELTYRHL